MLFILGLIIWIVINRRIDFLMNFNKLEYQEGVLTPLYYYESMQDIDARVYAEKCIEERWNYGCILNAYVYNKYKKPMTVSETSVFIDDIKIEIQPELYIIGEYSEEENTLTLYVVNNGIGKFDAGQICISIHHLAENSSVYLDESQKLSLLGENGIIDIRGLSGGEIRKLASYNINKTYMEELKLVAISYKIIEKEDNQFVESDSDDIGLMGYNNDLGIYFSLSEGDYSNVIVERNLIIDVENDKGRELRIPANFVVEDNYLKCILYALYPNASCELTFHAKIRCAGDSKYIETEKFTQRIYVPLYKEEGGFFSSIREFIKKYNIDIYYYNSNPIMQKEITYVPMQEEKEFW